MLTREIQSLGGKRTGFLRRKRSLEEYYKNPNLCLNCGGAIHVAANGQPYHAREKKFCNRSCNAIFNNKRRPKKIRVEKVKKKREIWLSDKTKEEIYTHHKTWQSGRNWIRRNAQVVFNRETNQINCKNCGYYKHIEVCHIKSVSSFSGETKVSEINNVDNLVGLCPNCHWEFDNNILHFGVVAVR